MTVIFYAKKKILFVARHSLESKGAFLLVDGFRKAKAELPDLTLTLVIDEKEGARFGDLTGIHIVDSSVSKSDLQLLFEEASLYAMPALNEPLGLVYVEALACKTPILGLDRLAFPEISGDGRFGFIVGSPDPDEIAKALIDAMTNPSRLRSMGEKGQQDALRRYDWDAVAGKILRRCDDTTTISGQA
jgi:glycosyltransferase involved in cell wall biosynthesis